MFLALVTALLGRPDCKTSLIQGRLSTSASSETAIHRVLWLWSGSVAPRRARSALSVPVGLAQDTLDCSLSAPQRPLRTPGWHFPLLLGLKILRLLWEPPWVIMMEGERKQLFLSLSLLVSQPTWFFFSLMKNTLHPTPNVNVNDTNHPPHWVNTEFVVLT